MTDIVMSEQPAQATEIVCNTDESKSSNDQPGSNLPELTCAESSLDDDGSAPLIFDDPAGNEENMKNRQDEILENNTATEAVVPIPTTTIQPQFPLQSGLPQNVGLSTLQKPIPLQNSVPPISVVAPLQAATIPVVPVKSTPSSIALIQVAQNLGAPVQATSISVASVSVAPVSVISTLATPISAAPVPAASISLTPVSLTSQSVPPTVTPISIVTTPITAEIPISGPPIRSPTLTNQKLPTPTQVRLPTQNSVRTPTHQTQVRAPTPTRPLTPTQIIPQTLTQTIPQTITQTIPQTLTQTIPQTQTQTRPQTPTQTQPQPLTVPTQGQSRTPTPTQARTPTPTSASLPRIPTPTGNLVPTPARVFTSSTTQFQNSMRIPNTANSNLQTNQNRILTPTTTNLPTTIVIDDEVPKKRIDEISEDDTKLKQNDNGTLLSRGGEFQADEAITTASLTDSALKDLQTTSDIRFFICGSCKNNPILIGSTPKLLPCLHSFCENCLQERYEKQKAASEGTTANSPPRLKCPSCGQEFLVAANDHPTSGFLNNQFVIESTAATATSRQVEHDNHQCTSCDDNNIANSYCMNCNEWLCDMCVKAHLRVKVTKDHIIQEKSYFSSQSNTGDGPKTNPECSGGKEKPLFCKVHSQEQLRLFCANCDKLTCRDCQLVEHKDHRYQFIDEAASKHREILKKLLQYLQINLGLLKETIVEVEKVSDALGSQENDIEADINKAFTCLIDAMKARQEALIKELKSLVSSKQALLAKQKKDLTQMRVILEHNHDFAEFAVKGGSNVALLYSRKVLGTRLHNLNSLKYRQRPLAFPDLKFSMDVDKLCAYFSKIGAAYSHEDMQRKIDHYHSKGASTNASRTIALSSRSSTKPLTTESPIASMSAINQRLSDSANLSTSTNTPYINLSKQGTLGLPGHQVIRSTNSPNMYNMNSHRTQATANNQDMIILSSSHQKSLTNNSNMDQSKFINAAKYMQQVVNKNGKPTVKTPTYDKMKTHPGMNFQSNSVSNNYTQNTSVNSSPNQHNANWSKMNMFGNKNSTIDQLKKMVEGTGSEGSITPEGNERPVSARSTSSDPGHTAQTGALSANGMVIVKQEEERSEEGGLHLPQPVSIPSSTQTNTPTGAVSTPPVSTNPPTNPVTTENNNHHAENTFDDGQNNEDYCGVCRNGGQLLCCDTCPKVYHLNCHIPALSDLPRDSWSCGLCVDIGQETRSNTSTLMACGTKRRYSKEMTDWQYKMPHLDSTEYLKLCEKILLCLSVHADSLPFHHKVSKVQVPDYYKVITNPMDLMTVRSKLSPQHFESYRSLQDFIVDIRLIFSNCFIYNSPDSDVCKMGVRLEKYFDSLLKKFVPDTSDSGPETEQPAQAKRPKDDGVFA